MCPACLSSVLFLSAVFYMALVANGAPLEDRELTPEAIDQFRQVALYSTNAKRAMHGSPPLNLDPSLNEQAQAMADRMASGDYSPASTTLEGNNFFWSGVVPNTITGEDPVNQWYSEVDRYDFNNPGQSMTEAYHFVHLVWKRATDVGMGVSKCTRGTNYVVAIYNPKANSPSIEEFEENVPRRL